MESLGLTLEKVLQKGDKECLVALALLLGESTLTDILDFTL